MDEEGYYNNLLIRAAPGLHEKIFRNVSKLMPINSKIIDFGAGQGALTDRLTLAGYKVTAVDINVDDFKASNYHEFVGLNFNNKQELDEFIEKRSCEFDIVLGIEVIEHVENPWEYIRTLYKLAKPGGYVVVSTPNITSWHSRLSFLRRGEYDEFGENAQHGHINPVSVWELKRIMNDVGLNEVVINGAAEIYPEKASAFQKIIWFLSLLIRPFQRGMLNGYCLIAIGKK